MFSVNTFSTGVCVLLNPKNERGILESALCPTLETNKPREKTRGLFEDKSFFGRENSRDVADA